MSDRVPFPYTNYNADSFFEAVKNSPGDHFFAITLNDELIGGLGLHAQPMNHSRNLEIGYWIGEPFWGKGYCTEAVKLALEIAFTLPDVHRVFARIYAANKSSVKVLLKNGFQLEGILKENIYKNGKFYDEIVLGKLQTG